MSTRYPPWGHQHEEDSQNPGKRDRGSDVFMLDGRWDPHTSLLRIQLCCELLKSTQSRANQPGSDRHLTSSHPQSGEVRLIHKRESRTGGLGRRCGKRSPLNLTHSTDPAEIAVLRVRKDLRNSSPHLCEWREQITAQNPNTALPPMEQTAPYRRCVQVTQTQRNRWTRSLQLSNHSARSRDELCPQSSATPQI